MSKLLIIQPTIVQNGKHADRGDIVEADERTTYVLISNGRALDADTKEAKELIAELSAEKAETEAKAKAKK